MRSGTRHGTVAFTSESGCLRAQSKGGGLLLLKLNIYGETDSEQVPRGKDEKHFEKRVQQALKLLSGNIRWSVITGPGHHALAS